MQINFIFSFLLAMTAGALGSHFGGAWGLVAVLLGELSMFLIIRTFNHDH